MEKKKFALLSMIIWIVISIFLTLILISGFIEPFAKFNLGSKFFNNEGGKTMISKNIILMKEEDILIDDMNEFNIECSYENIIVKIVNSDKLTLRQYGDPEKEEEYVSTFNNGRLHIYFNYENISRNFFNISIGQNYPRIEIYMPQKYSKKVSLSTSSGSIKIDGNPVWSDVMISSSSGSINGEKIDASSLSMEATSGSIRLDFVICKDNAKIQSSSGSMHLGNIKASRSSLIANSGSIHANIIESKDEVYISSSSGSIKTQGILTEKFNIQTTSGGFSVNNLKGYGYIVSSSGTLKIDDFTILQNTDIKASSGSVNISMIPSQNYKLNLKTSSGSIRCEMPVSYEGNRKNRATGIVGDGSLGTLLVTTSSGSIKIN